MAAMGLASGFGGFGNAALEYGKQIRSILEQRREGIANHLMQLALDPHTDLNTRTIYAKGATDVLSGKELTDIFKTVIPAHQKDQQSTAALGQAMGAPTSQPSQNPGPARPGQPVGSGGPPPAAQAPTSPVDLRQQSFSAAPNNTSQSPLASPQMQTQGSQAVSQPSSLGVGGLTPPVEATPRILPPPPTATAQAPVAPAPTGNIPSVMGASGAPSPDMGLEQFKIQNPQDIMNKYMGDPRWQTPANQVAMTQAMQDELNHNEALRQSTEQAKFTLAMGLERLKMLNDPRVTSMLGTLQSQGMPDMLAYMMVGKALGIDMPLGAGLMNTMYTPIHLPQQTADSVIQRWPQEAKEAGIQPGGRPVDVLLNKLSNRPTQIGDHAFRNTTMQGFDASGNPVMMMESPYQSPGPLGPVGGATPEPPSLLRPRTVPLASGREGMFLPGDFFRSGGTGNIPEIPGSTVPGLATTEKSQTPTWGGGTASEIKKIPAGSTASPVTPGQTVPPMPHGAAVPLAIRPFSENVPIDHLVHMIANDATNEKMISPRGPFSDANPSKAMVNKRMAELGIDPNNVTGSMRERSANAKLILQHLDEVDKIINEAESKGELGIVATHWNDFLTNQLGVDPTPDHIFSRLSGNQSFLSTAVAMAHGGLRGGGSPQMVAHWEEALKAADPETLKSKLSAARSWMQGYASLVGEAKMPGGSLTPPPVARAPNPFDASAARSKYNY